MKKYEPLYVEIVTCACDDILTGSNELPIIPNVFEEENELPIVGGL